MNNSKIKKLNRFTTLPFLLDILTRKKLTLLDPEKWDDKNDSKIICEYKRQKKIENVLVLCFSFGSETLHHWKTYANGSSGCCIEFDFDLLLKNINEKEGIRHKWVIYKKISEVESKKYEVDDIPFIKRWPYRFEKEYRIIWEGKTDNQTIEIDIPLDVIKKITISQEMPETVFKSVEKIINEITDNKIAINRSTLYENDRWINCFMKKNQT